MTPQISDVGEHTILFELSDVRPVQVHKSMKYSMKIRVQMPEPEIIGENGGR
jgi:hypothetical protein